MPTNASYDSEPQGFESLAQFHAQILVVLVERMNGFRGPSVTANDAGHQRLDDLLAENRIGCQLFHTVRRGPLTAGLADSFNHVFAANLCKIVGRTPRVVGFEFRSSEIAHLARQIGDGETGRFGT